MYISGVPTTTLSTFNKAEFYLSGFKVFPILLILCWVKGSITSYSSYIPPSSLPVLVNPKQTLEISLHSVCCSTIIISRRLAMRRFALKIKSAEQKTLTSLD
uniref:Uncharacterized protein n=1 Tax=Cacopsylla melanoneura TaxID=428564 RepID=A0A8D8ZD24_9HEMI